MKVAVWMFVQPRESSITPSDKVAQLVAKLAGAPVVWNEDWAGKWKAKQTDILFMVNGATGFCKNLPAVAPAIRKAKRIIFIQNDYAIVMPKPTSIGETPFRAAFRKRHEAGLPDMEYWSTIDTWAKETNGHYINWNAIGYTPLNLPPLKDHNDKVLYYGYWRDHRRIYFDRYFGKGGDWIDVVSPSKDFHASYDSVGLSIIPRERPSPPWKTWLKAMRQYSVGLYLEDTKSNEQYMSPATRFYEMLSASLPMAFDESCINTFKAYRKLSGYDIDIDPFAVASRKELRTFMTHRREIAKLQQKWHYDYYEDMVARAKKLIRKVIK